MFEEYERICEGRTGPVFAVSKEGENIIVAKGADDQGEFFLVTRMRRDGWHVRQKVYKA
jgi:hypothetical protein